MSTSSSILEQARARREAQKHSTAGTLPKVLFVDDDERILHALQSLFRMHYDVTVTVDGRQALALLRKHHYHLIVSDQRMPEIEGIEVLRQTREISPATVRILLTGFADLAAIVGSVNDGEVFRYINKPWIKEDLETTIARAVAIGIDLEAALSRSGPTALDQETQDTSPDCGSVLCIERNNQISELIRANPIDGVTVFDASTIFDALDAMHDSEVDVVVVAIDGDNKGNFDFLNLLKKRHPHVIAIVVSERADAATIINLINNVRIFRVIFRPVKKGALLLYLKSALKQADSYHHCPTLVKTQQQADTQSEQTDAATTKMSSSIGARLGSIKSFFSRAKHDNRA